MDVMEIVCIVTHPFNEVAYVLTTQWFHRLQLLQPHFESVIGIFLLIIIIIMQALKTYAGIKGFH